MTTTYFKKCAGVAGRFFVLAVSIAVLMWFLTVFYERSPVHRPFDGQTVLWLMMLGFFLFLPFWAIKRWIKFTLQSF